MKNRLDNYINSVSIEDKEYPSTMLNDDSLYAITDFDGIVCWQRIITKDQFQMMYNQWILGKDDVDE